MQHETHRTPYARHEQLVSAARSHPQIWRLFLGVVLILLVIAILNVIATLILEKITFPEDRATLKKLSYLIFLAGFVFVFPAVALAARWLQHRPLRSLVGPMPEATTQFKAAIKAIFLLICVLTILPPYGLGVPVEKTQNLSAWLTYAPLVLAALFVQVSAEELLFRGYLQQSLAARFRSPLIWMVVPSILFGLDHYRPIYGDNTWLMVIWAAFFGMLVADLTARAGTLGPAIALHFGNNVLVFLLISLTSDSAVLSMYNARLVSTDTGLLRQWIYVDFFFLVVMWLAARLAIRR